MSDVMSDEGAVAVIKKIVGHLRPILGSESYSEVLRARDYISNRLASPPAAAVQPVGGELTPQQIEQGWSALFSTENPYNPVSLKAFTKAVRWAEANTPTQQAQGEAVGLRQAVADLAYELRMAGDKSVCEDDGQVMQDFGARLTALVGAST